MSIHALQLGGGGGGGGTPVVSGGSSTDNAVVRWDGTSGTNIQNSGIIVTDNNQTTNPGAGAASIANTIFTGALFTGGSGTTTFPFFFFQPTGTTAYTGWSTSGTLIGANVTTVPGNWIRFRDPVGGDAFTIAGSGAVASASTASFTGYTVSTAGAGITFTSRGTLAPANGDGNFRFRNAAGTSGFSLSVSGTSTMVVRNDGASADARVQCNDLALSKTITPAGTTGNATINNACGTVNFAAAATSLTLTNSLITANSIILLTLGSNDVTCRGFYHDTPGAGSVVIRVNGTPAAECRCEFLVIN
jgi:hypothetical protein